VAPPAALQPERVLALAQLRVRPVLQLLVSLSSPRSLRWQL
jgi:hypothetical protein